MKDLTNKIIRYESDEMDMEEEINFFKELVDTGMAWTLQGHYGRRAHMLIDEGFIETPIDWQVLGNLDYRGCTECALDIERET